jgi:hypothetical protein
MQQIKKKKMKGGWPWLATPMDERVTEANPNLAINGGGRTTPPRAMHGWPWGGLATLNGWQTTPLLLLLLLLLLFLLLLCLFNIS